MSDNVVLLIVLQQSFWAKLFLHFLMTGGGIIKTRQIAQMLALRPQEKKPEWALFKKTKKK